MGVCHKCKVEMTIRDEVVTCFRCGNIFDHTCAVLSKPTARAIANATNLLFRCGDCLVSDQQNQGKDEALEASSSLTDDAMGILKAHIASHIESEVKKAMQQLELSITSLMGAQLSKLETSVAKNVEITAKGDFAEKTVSPGEWRKVGPRRKRRIMSTAQNELIQMEVDFSEEEVFEADGNQQKKISYAGAVKQQARTKLPSKPKQQTKAVKKQKVRILSNRTSCPVIVIKPVETSQEHNATIDFLKKTLDPKIHAINNFRNGKDGSIIAQCAADKDVNAMKNDIESCLGEKYEAVVPLVANPRVKIKGMSDRFVADEDLIAALKSQNEGIGINDARVVAVFENPRFKYNKFNAILEVDVPTFNNLMKVEKINIGFDRCPVVDALHILRCFKCKGFGHKSTECKNEENCSKCSEHHRTAECTSKDIRCVNCLKMNEDRKMSLDVNHEAFSSQCTVYRKLIERKKRNMQYAK